MLALAFRLFALRWSCRRSQLFLRGEEKDSWMNMILHNSSREHRLKL